MPGPEVVVPLLYLNGTPKFQLLENLILVRDTLQMALDDLRNNAYPARKDYFNTGWEAACKQCERRDSAILSLINELNAEIAGIDEQTEEQTKETP